jgi:hypothetical protein
MTTAVKSAISPFAQPKTKPNANAILFIDEQPASGIGEDFHKLPHFFSVIVLVATSAVEDEVTQKKQAPNTSVTDLNDTGNVCLPLDEAKVWLSFNAPDMFEFGGVKGCLSTREIHCNGRPVTLTSKEFKTLAYLIKNPRRVISRDELLNEVWGYQNYPRTRTVDNHILRLRKKLESEPPIPSTFIRFIALDTGSCPKRRLPMKTLSISKHSFGEACQ